MKTFKLQIKQQNTGHKFVSNSIFDKKNNFRTSKMESKEFL